MAPMFARAPTLAWLLTALACFLAGMAITEGRRQTGPLPALPTIGVVVTVEVTFPPVATEEPMPTPVAGGSGNVP